MHTENIQPWRHQHAFGADTRAAERQTRRVVLLTAAMMTVEILCGWLYNSMALLADGWHMSTHAAALGIAAVAYAFARQHAADKRFTFGTWKVEVLGGYTSAVLLAVVGLGMVWASVERLLHPREIQCTQALVVAAIGLAVNLVSALMLQAGDAPHDHDHDHEHPHAGHGHHHAHADLNLRSAYVHVIADALTSVLAIVALLGAKFMHWNWLDPLMGIVGAALILRWTWNLARDTSSVLLDREMDSPVIAEIHQALESDGDTRISDVHLWRVGQGLYACIIALVARHPQYPDVYKARLHDIHELAHVTIEVHACPDGAA